MNHNWVIAHFASVFANLLRDASVQTASMGGGRAAPSFAALSASSLPEIFRCPGTQQTHMAPGCVCGRRIRKGHFLATSINSSKIDCEELTEGASSLIATSRLSRKIHISVANLADGRARAALAP